MQLVATPASHFARKVRLLLDHYGLEYEFINAGNVAEFSEDKYAGSPIMQVPVLLDGDLTLYDSDHIAAYLVRKHDPQDRYGVLTTDVRALNARAVLNGMMIAEARLVLGARTGLKTDNHPYFDKSRAVFTKGFEWLDANLDLFNPGNPGYLDFHLISSFDHMECSDLARPRQPGLIALRDALRANATIAASAPPPPIVYTCPQRGEWK